MVGDVAGNLAKAREARADAARQGADLVLFTELFLAGYPPEDLVNKPAFLRACERAAEALVADTADGGPGVIVGTPLKRKSGVHNSIIFADGGKIAGRALQDRSAQLWRVRREARLPGRAGHARADQFPRRPASASRSARTSGASSASARRWPKAAPKSCWCRMARPTIAARSTCASRWSSAK